MHRGFLLVFIMNFVFKTKQNGNMQFTTSILILTASVLCSRGNTNHFFKLTITPTRFVVTLFWAYEWILIACSHIHHVVISPNLLADDKL
jgi:hypothetical protein